MWFRNEIEEMGWKDILALSTFLGQGKTHWQEYRNFENFPVIFRQNLFICVKKCDQFASQSQVQ